MSSEPLLADFVQSARAVASTLRAAPGGGLHSPAAAWHAAFSPVLRAGPPMLARYICSHSDALSHALEALPPSDAAGECHRRLRDLQRGLAPPPPPAPFAPAAPSAPPVLYADCRARTAALLERCGRCPSPAAVLERRKKAHLAGVEREAAAQARESAALAAAHAALLAALRGEAPPDPAPAPRERAAQTGAPAGPAAVLAELRATEEGVRMILDHVAALDRALAAGGAGTAQARGAPANAHPVAHYSQLVEELRRRLQ
jgi:hypothetical protein